ncbi:MAG: PAS domain S-box protein [Bacteroidetes bacterium]|nr:PAS domain S-box protein [Bacteroidota bacterium]
MKTVRWLLPAIVLMVGVLVMAGWQWDIEVLRRPLPHLAAMNPLSAVLFIASSFSLLLYHASGRYRYIALIFAVAGVIVAALRMIDAAGGLGWDIDLVFFRHRLWLAEPGNVSNRMGLNTALGFLLICASLLLTYIRRGLLIQRAAVGLALAAMVLGTFSLLCYLYYVPEFYSLLGLLPISVHSSICFMLMAAAIVGIHEEVPLMRAINSQHYGGVIARRLIPAIMGLTILFGYMRLYASWQRPFSTELGVAILITLIIMSLIGLTWYLAALLNKSDKLRTAAEVKLQKFNSDLRQDVSRQTRKILDNEQHFREKMDNMREGIQIIGHDWRYIYVNDALVAQSHYTREELIGRTPMELYPGVEATALYAVLQEVMTHRVARRTEDVFTFPDGSQNFFDMSIQPVPEGIFILSVDITEQRRNANRVLKMNRLYAFLSAINQSLVHIREEKQLLDRLCDIALGAGTFNGMWLGLYNAAGNVDVSTRDAGPDGTVDGIHFDNIAPDDPRFYHVPIGVAWRTGQYAVSNDAWSDPHLTQWHEVMRERNIKSVIGFPLRKHGVVVGAFAFVCDTAHFFDTEEIALLDEVAGDISFALEVMDQERKRTEAERLLEVNQAHLTRAQAIAHVGHWEASFATGIAVWSEESCRMFGLDPSDRLHSYETWLSFIHPDDLQMVLEENKKPDVIQTGVSFDHRIIWRDGTVRYLHSEAKYELNDQGQPIGMYGISQDITERKLAEQEIHQLNEQLEHRVEERTAELTEANKALEAFSYSASHDLRAPLRAISGYIGVINEEYGKDFNKDLTQLFAQVSGGAKRMNAIIDDMLTLARYSKGNLQIREIDMDMLVQTVWDNLSITTPNHACLIKQKLPLVQGDFSMLEQVLVNLLSNAIKYSSKKAEPAITIGCSSTAAEVTFFIQDNGAGFDMAAYSKLFGAFQRLHGASEFEGTGVGLLLVKRIIEKHGGLVWAEGKVGEGATFYFSLPLTDDK